MSLLNVKKAQSRPNFSRKTKYDALICAVILNIEPLKAQFVKILLVVIHVLVLLDSLVMETHVKTKMNVTLEHMTVIFCLNVKIYLEVFPAHVDLERSGMEHIVNNYPCLLSNSPLEAGQIVLVAVVVVMALKREQ